MLIITKIATMIMLIMLPLDTNDFVLLINIVDLKVHNLFA